jgi:hypothetical protein
MSKGDDSKKYFHIQVGSQEVNGTLVSIDINKSPDRYIKDMTSSYTIKYVDGDEPHYLFFEKSNGLKKEKPTLKAIIEGEGNLRIIETKERIFKTEIDETQVGKILKGLKN